MKEIIYKCDHCKKQIQSPPLICSIPMTVSTYRFLPADGQAVCTIPDMDLLTSPELPHTNKLFCNWHCLVSHSGSINGGGGK
jgi:hypothetical protein